MSSDHDDAVDHAAVNVTGALAVAISDRLDADSRAAALITLLERDALTIEWLRRIIGLSHSATVRLVDRLADDGLALRRAGPDDRSVSILLTAHGRRTAERLRRGREATLGSLLAPLEPAERRTLLALAEKVLAGAVGGRWEARLICRLCDHGVCAGAGGCPVDRAATERGE
ncbi:MAG TPA: MarR family transcriptional regulator [Solirubrobacteraceae bacterium]|nr:MarR family transcriptional regulator [Solirubrobacteraceae bacterium]